MNSHPVNLGESSTGIGGDPLRTALAKYNAHYHSSPFSNFIESTIQPGAVISSLWTTSNGSTFSVFPNNTTVQDIYLNILVLSENALYSVASTENFVVTISGVQFNAVSSTAGSNTLTLVPSNDSFPSSSFLERVYRVVLSGMISNVSSASSYYLLLKNPYTFHLDYLSFKTSVGQCDITTYIEDATNGVRYVQSHTNPASTTTSEESFFPFSATRNSTVFEDDQIRIRTSAVTSSNMNLFWTLKGTMWKGPGG